MKRMLSDLTPCDKCRNQKICKYFDTIKKCELEDPDIPGIHIEVRCKNFQSAQYQLFGEGIIRKADEVVTNKEFEFHGDVAYPIPPACKSCPQHPSNGGSGICHCTLGTLQVTC